MCSINIEYCIVAGIVLCGMLGWQVAEARVAGQFYYGLNAKDKSDAQNETTSILGLSISDNLISSKIPTQYDLEAKVIYDHENNVTNEQYTGNFDGRYIFIKPSLWWNYFGEVDVVPLDTGIEIDNLNSQNLSTISTGPTISLWKNLRGSVDLTALYSITNYSDSNLDSNGNETSLNYFYPYSEIMSVTYSLNYESVTYDDVSNSADDFELLDAGVTISRNTANSNFELILEHGDLENNNNSTSENMIELNVGYQINGFSNIAMEISNSLQTSAEFLRLDDNPDNAVFRSGLFRNKRFQLNYGYVTNATSYEFQIYTNQLETIFDAVQTAGNIDGVVFGFSNELTNEINLFIGLESTDDDFLNQRSKELEVTATYTRRHSRRLFSEFVLTIENDRVNNVDSNDTIIEYRLTSKLF